MRDAMKAAEDAGRFKEIGFDAISLASEYGHRPYVWLSENIMRVGAALEHLRDVRNTESALAKIVLKPSH